MEKQDNDISENGKDSSDLVSQINPKEESAQLVTDDGTQVALPEWVAQTSENNTPSDIPQINKRNKLWTAFGIISFSILLLYYGFAIVNSLLMAFKDFLPAKGLQNSAFTGLDNFQLFLSDPLTQMIMGNTVRFSLLTILFTCIIVVPLIYGLNKINNIRVRIFLAGITFLPFLLTRTVLVEYLRPILTLSEKGSSSFSGQGIRGIIIFLLLGAFYQTILIVPFLTLGLIMLSRCFTLSTKQFISIAVAASIGFGWYSGFCGSLIPRRFFFEILRSLEIATMPEYLFSIETSVSRFHFSTAGSVLTSVIGKSVLLFMGIACIAILSRKKEPLQGVSSLSDRLVLPKKNAMGAIISMPALLILFVVFIVGISSAFTDHATVGESLYQDFSVLPTVFSILFPFFGTLLGVALAGLTGQGKWSSRIFMLLSILYLLPSNTYMRQEYYMLHRMGWTNTNMALIDFRFAILIPALFVGMYLKSGGKSTFRIFCLTGASYIYTSIYLFGDSFRSTIFYTSRKEQWTLPRVHFEVESYLNILMREDTSAAIGSGQGLFAGSIPVAIFLFLALIAASALLVTALSEEKKNTETAQSKVLTQETESL